MTVPQPSCLLCPTPLADVRKRPAAILWQAVGTGSGAPEAFPLWLASEDFQHLSAQVPQLWAESALDVGDPTLRDVIVAAGGGTAPPASILSLDQEFPAALPPGVAWVGGAWYRNPPKSLSVAQEASRAQVLRLVKLVATDAETRDLEAIFRQDANLSYQLLRLVNSPAFASRRPITSFTQAILLIGRQQLRRWLNLMLFSARADDHRSGMLMALVTLRARGMELLAREAGLDRADQDQAFMVGMFSLLPVLFGRPRDEILDPLNLSPDLNGALREGTGPLGLLLHTWESCEMADAEALRHDLAALAVAPLQFNTAALGATRWALDVVAATSGK